MVIIQSVTCVTSPVYYNTEISDSFLSPSDNCIVCCPNEVIYNVKARKHSGPTKEAAEQKAQIDLAENGPIYAQKNASYHKFQFPVDSIDLGVVNALYLDYNLHGKTGKCCDNIDSQIQFSNLSNCFVQQQSGSVIRISKKMKDFNGDFSFDILTLCNGIAFANIRVTGRFLYIREQSCETSNKCENCDNCNKCH